MSEDKQLTWQEKKPGQHEAIVDAFRSYRITGLQGGWKVGKHVGRSIRFLGDYLSIKSAKLCCHNDFNEKPFQAETTLNSDEEDEELHPDQYDDYDEDQGKALEDFIDSMSDEDKKLALIFMAYHLWSEDAVRFRRPTETEPGRLYWTINEESVTSCW